MNIWIQKISKKLGNLDFFIVSISTIFSSLISFLFSILARRYISPFEYGIYSTCLLLQSYLSYAQLGVLNAYNRDYPQLIGAKKIEKSKILKDTTFTFFVGSYSVLTIVIGIILSVIFLNSGMSKEYFVGYLISMILLIGNTLSDFGMNTIRMNGGYNYTALVTITRSVLSAVAGGFGILIYGYYGLYIMLIISDIIAISLYYKYAFKGIKLRINKQVLKDSLWSGFPLMINSLVWTAVASVDKFVIIGFMGAEALGIYSVAQLGFSVTVLIPQSMSQVFYIKISNVYGKSKDEQKLVKLCNRYTLINAVCTSIICVCGYYILPIFVRIVMPNYADGVFATQIMLVGLVIYGSTMLYGNIFSVLRLNMELLWTSILLCLFNIIFSISLVLLFGMNIENVAMGTSVSYAFFSWLLILKISKKFKIRVKEFFEVAWLPIIVIVIPALVIYYMLPNIYIAMLMSMIYILFVSICFTLKLYI